MRMFQNFQVMRLHRLYLAVSAFLVALSLLGMLIKGLVLGIDFTGGTLLERRFPQSVTTAQVREVLSSPELADLAVGDAVVQTLDEARDVLIRTRALTNDEIRRVDDVLSARLGEVTIRRTELVGPVIGGELVRKALWALALSAAAVLVYLSFRFEFKYAAIAVVAVLHDVAITLGYVAWTGIELNASFVAVILTLVGYSLNATIVIFDRVRELWRLNQRESLAEVVNRAVRDTMARSVNTNLTTLLVIVALTLFGGATIRNFASSLMVGIIAGTYSSVFISSPLWALWQQRSESRSRVAAKAVG